MNKPIQEPIPQSDDLLKLEGTISTTQASLLKIKQDLRELLAPDNNTSFEGYTSELKRVLDADSRMMREITKIQAESTKNEEILLMEISSILNLFRNIVRRIESLYESDKKVEEKQREQ